jgi:Mg-chelatase subunit ChlD
MAAATVAALAASLHGPSDQLAVVAFWSDAAVVHRWEDVARPNVLLDSLLRIPTRGLTNVHFGLTVAASELARSTARQRRAILLSDAVHNAGPDPRTVAVRLPALHVLLETDGEHDEPLGRDLARLGNGRFARVPTYLDVAPALNAITDV